MIYHLLTCWLAVFGVSVTISTLDGPFGWCARLRKILLKHPMSWVRHGIECPICVSFWVAPFIIVIQSLQATNLQAVPLWLSSVGFTAAISWLSPPSTPPVA